MGRRTREAGDSDFDLIREALARFESGDFAKRVRTDAIDDARLRGIAAALNLLGERLERAAASQGALREEREFYRQVLEAIPLGLVVKDAVDGFRVRFWNRAMEKLTGAPASKVLGKVPKEAPEAEGAERVDRRDWAALRRSELEFVPQVQTPGNESRSWVDVRKAAVRDPATGEPPRYLLALFEDVSSRVELEERRRDLEVEAFHSRRMASLGEISAGVAHEINNPLAIIHGRAALLEGLLRQEGAGLLKEKGGEYVRVILQACDRIGRIVQGMRAYARDASQDPFESAPVERIVNEALSVVSERFRVNDVRLSVSGVGPEDHVDCREGEIVQVLVNLLSNAFDAAVALPERWVEIEVRMSLSTLEIAVTDCGPGLPKEVRDKLAQPFFTTKPIGKGTGLGLAVCKGIARSHRGRLWVDDRCRNTRFVLEIPIFQANKKRVA